jgi:ribosomal protein S18 acetylase RimI-like enzyme
VHYVHPDKRPELWVNEVGVAPAYRNQGVGRRLLAALFECGWAAGCTQAWVGTEVSNAAARRLYQAVGGHEDAERFVLVSFELTDAAPDSSTTPVRDTFATTRGVPHDG